MKLLNHAYNFDMVSPSFEHNIVSTIIDLEKLRTRQISTDVHPSIFFQLKEIFHMIESLGSARIEGNNTTISEIVERKIEEDTVTEKITEIDNVEQAMKYIEEVIQSGSRITKKNLLDIQTIVVHGLIAEGDRTPGIYRTGPVLINKSKHLPPEAVHVESLMEQLIDFVNYHREKKHALLAIAIAHHAFTWIHPFNNGNGRTVRVLTYAMLIQQGFNVHNNRLLNPTAIFCIDRNIYYDMLAKGDKQTEEGKLIRCEYVLSGLLREINKIDRLLDFEYLTESILFPSILDAKNKKLITDEEFKILKIAIQKGEIEQKDIKDIFPGSVPAAISRQIRYLKEKKMLSPLSEKSRKYTISFVNNYLLRSVIKTLREAGFDGVIDQSIE